MTSDLLIVFGLACVAIGLIRLLSAFEADQSVSGAVIMGGLGCAMILAGAAMNPMGFTAQNIPDAVMRVVNRFGG